MPLVEVVPHPGTDKSSVDKALEFYKSVGRSPVLIRQETPGFAVNRLQMALCAEAYSLVSRGIMSAEDLGKTALFFFIVVALTQGLNSDTCITTSLGPRWAITGPFQSNALGGGGGGEGFKHFIDHIGSAGQGWLKDMQENAFEWTPENISTVSASVDEQLKGQDTREVEQKRDRFFVDLFRKEGGAGN
jgi:3-hydroxyacyl-CoA dehydrogenase